MGKTKIIYAVSYKSALSRQEQSLIAYTKMDEAKEYIALHHGFMKKVYRMEEDYKRGVKILNWDKKSEAGFFVKTERGVGREIQMENDNTIIEGKVLEVYVKNFYLTEKYNQLVTETADVYTIEVIELEEQ